MEPFSYHLRIEEERRLVVSLVEQGKKRRLYRSCLMERAAVADLELLSFLIEQKLKVTSLQHREGMEFNDIVLPPSQVLKGLELLLKTGRLFWRGETVTFCFRKQPGFQLYAEELALGQWKIWLTLLIEAEELSLNDLFSPKTSKLALHLPPPLLCFYKNRIYCIQEEFDRRWLDRFHHPQILLGKEAEKVFEEWELEMERAPFLTKLVAKDPLPVLQMRDRFGLFYTLLLDGAALPHRSDRQYLSFVKDLEELGFQKRGEEFYISSDKIEENLTLLYELGWRILDSKGQAVAFLTGFNLATDYHKHDISVSGTLSFNDAGPLSVKEGIHALKNGLQFVSLPGDRCALLDRRRLGAQLKPLLALSEGTLTLRREEIGLLSPLIAKGLLQVDFETERFYKALISFTGLPQASPSSQFLGSLHPYQKKGVEWLFFLYQERLGGILADEMGLGKTVQILALFSQVESLLPILIVVPASLLHQWKGEFAKFLPTSTPYLHEGNARLSTIDAIKQQRYILISYGLLRRESALFSSMDYDMVILDEAQVIKNSESKIAQAVYGLSARFKLSITGTPIENREEELFSQLRFILPAWFNRAKEGLLEKGSKVLAPFILRRLKRDVAEDLPEKIEQKVWLSMGEEQQESYDQFYSRDRQLALSSLEEGKQERVLEFILRLRQLALHPHLVDVNLASGSQLSAKLSYLLEEIPPLLEEGHKILVFSQFTKMLSLVEKELVQLKLPSSYFDGTLSLVEREKRVRAFKESKEGVVFLISLKSGGYGLNLNEADYVFVLDPWWNEAAESQAVDRAHRLGKRSVLIVKKLVMMGTIEEKLLLLKEKKQLLADTLIDPTGDPSTIRREDWAHLLC